MRRRPLFWFIISALCFAGAVYFWQLGERWAAQGQKKDHGPRTTDHGPQKADPKARAAVTVAEATLSHGGALGSPAAFQMLTNRAFAMTNRFALRLTNSSATISQLQRSDRAILLENALLDTTKGAPAIPAHLLAQGDPGTWVVQARGPITKGFRSLLADAGATIISYIPNNAYLVRASKAVADQLEAGPLTQAVLPYEPYYKLNPSLLPFAVTQTPLPATSGLNVLLFADSADQTQTALQNLGAEILGTPERTPFGPVVTVRSTPTAPNPGAEPGALLSAIAGLPGVQEVEWALTRTAANDLSRVTIGVATDVAVATNWLGLTGTNVLVNVNDSGVDASHPDLAPRVFGLTTNALVDSNGHGTHVAGIIASSGGKSSTVLGAAGPLGPYGGTNGPSEFRGMAPAASLFSVPFGLTTGPFAVGETEFWPSDALLQETPAKTNCFISNNSWNYTGPDDYPSYDLHAASYDAAVRDALPNVSGSQPLLIVFSAGNNGGGDNQGGEGYADTILSPATAKNVITVGAIEQNRNVTNIVTVVTEGVTNTSQPWLPLTDSSNLVASFSSRGNVGVGVEGKYGRFKPDVVAPGTFVISTKSQQWDTNAYYNPTSHLYYPYPNMFLATNQFFRSFIFIPENAVQWNLDVSANTNSPVPFPDLTLLVKQSGPPTNPPPDYDAIGTNHLSLPPARNLDPVDAYWYYGIQNSTTQNVNFDFSMDITVTNELGDYLSVLEGMNDALGPYYRYETGTSMSAADASGVLALMQEFFQRQARTNSPALMKAMLINGARSLGGAYDFFTQPPINFQGWGLINLPTTVPASLTNSTSTTNSMVLVDQNPATALATGQSQTFHLTLSPTATTQPLRVTLVWTDPPGNPVASVKLVNDLDLIVTNLDSTNLFYLGNDIQTGNDFNQPVQTNDVADSVNNVENVYLNPAAGVNGRLGTNYSITVYGHRVNVNAVNAQTNNVCQDYALVVSTGDGLLPDATLTLNTNVPVISVTQPLVTPVTNSFGATTRDFSGGILLNQRVGANTQLQGTNTLPVTGDANAVFTTGMTNQWHFYVITNDTGFTNAAFLTFLPPTLSIPRMGVFAATVDNASGEADIDLYVAPPTIPNNYALTNLDTNVLVATDKSLSRGGTEYVIYSNAVNGVYYFGVKSEDQMAAQYAIMGVFSRFPFGTTDQNGDQSLIGIPTFQPIPDGSPATPGYSQIIAIAAQPIPVRRVIVTNTITHQLMTDLLGNLSHASQFDVLNNHTCVVDPASGNCQICTTYVYDDSNERNVGPGVTLFCGTANVVQPSDGPGSLHNFVAQDGVGPWILTMTDNQVNNIGTNISMEIFLERQPDLTAPGGIIATIQPGGCREDYVTLPANAVSLTVEAAIVTASPPIIFSIDVCPFNTSNCKSTLVTNSLGGSVTIDLTDTPPLQPGGTYTVRICNLGATAITLNIKATIGTSLSTIFPERVLTTTQPQAITDDAVTDYYITNNFHNIISSVNVGLLIQDPRASDLAITLVSPNGTRILLFENRGGASTAGIGTFGMTTNVAMQAFFTNNFDLAPVGLYATGAVFQGWSVVSNMVDVLDDFTCLCQSNHIVGLLDGAISNSLPTTNALPLTNSYTYGLSYKVNHLPWLEGMVTWWPLDVDGSDIFGGMDGLLLGDVTFSQGQTVPLFDDFSGPLNPNWQSFLPAAGAGYPPVIANYVGAPGYFFTTLGTNNVIELTNVLSAQERCGWSSAASYVGQSFRYDVRFNTQVQAPGVSVGGLVEIWLFDALNPSRYDVVSLFGGNTGTARQVLPSSTIDNTNYTLPYSYQNNTWYHLVIAGNPGQPVRASLFDDNGNELVGQNFAHGPAAFSERFRIGLSQYMTTPAVPSPVAVAVDSATLKTTMLGEVNQAFIGDGVATRMIVPGCEELNLGLGRGLSIEGWVWPGGSSAASSGLGSAIYNARTDFSTNANPNGPWKYSWSPSLTGSQTVFRRFSKPPVNNGLELMWDDPTHDAGWAPSVAVNSGGDFNDGNVTFKAGVLLVTAGTTGGDYAHVVWTAPHGGQYLLNSLFYAQQNGIDVDAHVLVKGVSIYDSTITSNGISRAFSTTLLLSAGDTVDFAVGPNGNVSVHAANTGLEASLTPVSASMPVLEWTGPTNGSPPGVQFWVNGLLGITNLPGSLWANIWDTNMQPHIIGTTTNALTNGGWQHVALTYDTNSGIASLYVNGLTNGLALVRTNIGHFVPRTSGDVYLGFHPSFGLSNVCYSGGLDEFSLYDRALTPCEVNAIYQADGRGKYGTNVLVCPVVTSVTLSNTPFGNQTLIFTNGISWVTNGPHWETNTISYTTTGTNPTPIVVRGFNPYSTNDTSSLQNLNAVVDDFVLTELVSQTADGLLFFTENTNLATLPIKLAPVPYTASNFPPVLIFTNDFSYGTARVYQADEIIRGSPADPSIGRRDWTVSAGPITVVSNTFLDPVKTNFVALASGAVQCQLPTIPGHRYELTYSLRGPCAVGWWNGSIDPLSQRALDLISGNNGAMLNGATNSPIGYVGPGFFLVGQPEPPPALDPDLWPEDIDDPASQIELGDPPQLQLTNAFTLEAWIMPMVPTNEPGCGTEQIFFRGYPEPFDCGGLGDPYWLALEPTANPLAYNLHFHIADAHYGTVGADVRTTNAPILIGGSTNVAWYHIAAVFDKPYTNIVVTNGANVFTFSTNQMRLYLNGVCVMSNYTTLSPYKDLDPSLNPGADIGSRCRFDWTQPFAGFMDEVTVYARALTEPEISAEVQAGRNGKADLVSAPPAMSLAKLKVTVDGIQLGTGYGDNSQWTTQSLQFTALDTNAVVTLQSLLPGTLLDGITLTEVSSQLYYLPEESLSALGGEDAFGVWTLEIWDSRVGPTNSTAQLTQWQLDLLLAPSNPPPVITLQHGITYSNSIAAYSAQYFVVPVPQWAVWATNILEFANQVHTTTALPATVLYNPTNFPGLTDLALLNGPPYPTTPPVALTTNTTPAVTNGQSYYLLVTNPNPVGLSFGLQVAFDITTLEPCQMLVSNVVRVAGIPRYFQFDVPTNFPQASLPPQAVSFWVSNTACNLKVVLSQHLPLPDLDHFDYISQQPCTNDQIIMVVTNTTPFPIQTNRWYVGVFNTSTTNVMFSAEACLTAGYPVIIPLTNGIPYVVSSTNSPFAAPPGPPQLFFFDFLVLNSAPGVLFELYNLSGDADLVLQQAVPPTMWPYFAISSFEGTTPEQIVLRTDPTKPASVFVPDLRGQWYLGIYNNETNRLSYTIRATLPDSDRLLSSAQPLHVALTALAPPHGLLLSWNSVIGERYFVQYTPSIATPIIWTNLGSVVASTPLTTFEVLPVPANGGFFRVLQLFDFQPILHIQNVATNVVRLYWSTAYVGYSLQYKNGIVGPWQDLTTTPPSPYPPYPPAVQEGLNWAAYDRSDTLVPKFYRLILK